MRKSQLYVVGAVALFAAFVCAAAASPKGSTAIRTIASRQKTDEVLSAPTNLTYYQLRSRRDRLQYKVEDFYAKIEKAKRNSKEPKKEDEENLSLYRRALLETQRRMIDRLFFERSEDLYSRNRKNLSHERDYLLSSYCAMCAAIGDVDSLENLENEFNEGTIVSPSKGEEETDYYRAVVAYRIVSARIQKAIDDHNDAELETIIDQLEDAAVVDAVSAHTLLFNNLTYVIEHINVYSPQLARRAKESIKRGYQASARPFLAKTAILE